MAEAKKPTTTTAVAKSIVPRVTYSIAELMQMADILYKGGGSCLPNVDRPEKVFHLLLFGQDIGLSATQSLAGLAMGKNGKPSIMGDTALALVRQSGLLEDIKETWEGEGEERKGVCVVTRAGEESRRFEFSVADANRAGLIDRSKGQKGDGPWVTYRDRMLRYRPLGFALRDVFPDVLKGLYITEEANDIPENAPDVKVLGTTTNGSGTSSPAPQQQLPAAPTETATPAPDKPITDEQKEAFKQLHPLVMASKGVGTDVNARKAAWEQTLAPYGVSSIGQMTVAVAAKALEEIGKAHDPFGHPASQAGAAG